MVLAGYGFEMKKEVNEMWKMYSNIICKNCIFENENLLCSWICLNGRPGADWAGIFWQHQSLNEFKCATSMTYFATHICIISSFLVIMYLYTECTPCTAHTHPLYIPVSQPVQKTFYLFHFISSTFLLLLLSCWLFYVLRKWHIWYHWRQQWQNTTDASIYLRTDECQINIYALN